MRCLACGAEMALQQTTGEDAVAVSGFERRTFVCSACGDSEQRLAFVKQDERALVAPAPMERAGSFAPSSSSEKESAVPRRVIKRIFASLTAVRDVVERRLVFVTRDKTAAAQSMVDSKPSLDPQLNIEPPVVRMEAPSLADAESDDDIDECEVLLKRAIEIVQTPVRRHEPPERNLETQLEPSAPSASPSEIEIQAPPLITGLSNEAAATPAADTNCEQTELAMAEPATAVAPERAPVVVEIQYDAAKARYIAKDINTGLSILRIADHERLRQMCDRLGWQVITPMPDTAN
jgi:hypothetical protein